MSRMNNDVANIKTFLSSTLNFYLSNTLMTIFILLMSLEMDYRLTLVFVGILPLYTLLMYYVHSRTNKDFRIHQEDLGDMIGYIGESFKTVS